MNIRKIISKIIREQQKTELLSEEERRVKMEFSIPDDIIAIKDLFKLEDYKLYVVGGAVRDLILNKTPKDFDLATNALPNQIIKLFIDFYGLEHEEKNGQGETTAYFLKNGYRLNLQGAQFGIIAIYNIPSMPEGVEIATFRKDIGAGRRPDSVEFTTIDNDVKRRDLTINALFYDIDTKEVVDLVGGIEDIQNGVVRTVGDAGERFGEDRLRILRAIRFAARFGSELHQSVDAALKSDSRLGGFSEEQGTNNISVERIRDEFLKGIKSAKSVTHFLQMLEKYNMFQWIFGELTIKKPYIQERNHITLISYLLQDNSVDLVKRVLFNFKYTGDEITDIAFLILLKTLAPENAYRLKKVQKLSHLSNQQIERFATYSNLNLKLIRAFIKFELSVSGHDFLSQGLKGKAISDAIERKETENFLNQL